MKNIGIKIRKERKEKGMTLEEMAKKIGISAITLQRIETGKTSPSVVVLSDIALILEKPIFSFLEETNPSVKHLKKEEQRTISTSSMKFSLIGPKNMIKENIYVTFGEFTKIDPHTNPGIEFVYNIEGTCEHKIGDSTYILNEGDSIAYDAKVEHSVDVVGGKKAKFFSVYVLDEKI